MAALPATWPDTCSTWTTNTTAMMWWSAAAPVVAAGPLLKGLKLARAHLAALAASALAPDPPAPAGQNAAAGAPGRAWATRREHRLRPGSRRRARPQWAS
jgi:hypothetical protein